MRLTLNCIDSSLSARLPQVTAETASSQPLSLRVRANARADSKACVPVPAFAQLGHRGRRLTADGKVDSGAAPIRFQDGRDSAHSPAGGLSTFEKEMCRSQRICVSSVQTLARVRAASREPGALIVCNASVKPVTTRRESPAFESARGGTCPSVRSDCAIRHDDSHTFFFAKRRKEAGYHTLHSSLAIEFGSRFSGRCSTRVDY